MLVEQMAAAELVNMARSPGASAAHSVTEAVLPGIPTRLAVYGWCRFRVSRDTTSANHPAFDSRQVTLGRWGDVTVAARGPSGSCVPRTGPSVFDHRGDADPKAN